MDNGITISPCVAGAFLLGIFIRCPSFFCERCYSTLVPKWATFKFCFRMSSPNFYTQLPAVSGPLPRLLREGRFAEVPPDWHAVVADVKGSSAAVAAGKHNDVNLVAAGSLIAALNVAKAKGIEIPFFFGGDGSTLLLPEAIMPPVMAALGAHNSNSQKTFGLAMHIGSVPVAEAAAEGHSIGIAKLAVDAAFHKAIAVGNGLRWAEEKIKGTEPEAAPADTSALNLTGLECRWNRIKPGVKEAENVCYLIEAVDPSLQAVVYAAVFDEMEEVYGAEARRSPLSPERLKMLLNLKKLRTEMMVKFGGWNPRYFLWQFVRTAIGRLYFKYNWTIGGLSGQEYLAQLIAHADTLTVDGRINTIVCAPPERHERFLRFLQKQEAAGLLVYGHYASKESIMTCYIENLNQKHIHFVDGADGGYTLAARELKVKLKAKTA